MDTDRQNNYTSYLGHLSSSGTTYRKIGLAAKYVLTFLEKADEISRRGYQRFTSRHWQQASEKVCKDFRAFLEEVSAQVYEIEEGAFKKSGTGVGTIAIVINKKMSEK